MSDHEQRAQLELVQIAAVVASILEAQLHGATEFERWVTSADGGPAQQGWEILELFAKERQRQDEKWGDQESHGVITWAMILTEEIGEWADELRISDQEQTEEEYGVSAAVLKHLALAGEGARKWLNGHEWPERQQQVFDEEEKVARMEAREVRSDRDDAMGAEQDRPEQRFKKDEKMRANNAHS